MQNMPKDISSALHCFDVEITSSLVLFCKCIIGLTCDSTILVEFGQPTKFVFKRVKDESISYALSSCRIHRPIVYMNSH